MTTIAAIAAMTIMNLSMRLLLSFVFRTGWPA